MKNFPRCAAAIAAWAALTVLAGCASQQVKDKAAVEKFKQDVTGQYVNEVTGATLFIVPVRARMVTDEALYVERHDGAGVMIRIVNIFTDKEGKIRLGALTFTQEGQWRELRENPELLTALLPKDVRPAGTCDITPGKDNNAITFSCGGSTAETFKRL
jgi:hypothetical protein